MNRCAERINNHFEYHVGGGAAHPNPTWYFVFMDKLGFTWYPQDWWSSDTFYEFDVTERYIFLECISLMYRNDGYIKTQKTQIENRLRIQISDKVWGKVTSKFIKTGDQFTSITVNKRLKKAMISRENGKSGGRPKKDKNPENPTSKPKEKEKEKKESEIEVFGINPTKAFAVQKKYLGENACRVNEDGFKEYCDKHQVGLWFKKEYQVGLFWKDWDGKLFNDHAHVNTVMINIINNKNG